MSSRTANISNSSFCSSFETGRIIPEMCCITKAAIKTVHFCTELSKVAALVATSTCLFSCCNFSSVDTTAGNSVTIMMIESCHSTRRVAQIGFSFCRDEAEPETSRQKNAYVRSSCHRISNNWQLRWSTNDQVKNMLAAMNVRGQRVQFFYSSLDTTIFSAHITCAIITLATHMFQIKPKLR